MSTSTNTVGKPAGRVLRFTQQREFRKTLNERVNAYLRDNALPARDVPAMYLKTAVVLGWWLGAYLLLLLGHFPPPVNVVLCVIWGMAIAAVGFNVMHDANHNGYSDNPRINKAGQPQRRNPGHQRVSLAHQAQRVASHLHQHRRLRR